MDRAIFCDIDGCLGPGKHKTLDLAGLAQVRQLIADLAGQGASFHLCTGRPQPYAEAMNQVLGLQTPFICENGAMVFNPASDSGIGLVGRDDLSALKRLEADLRSEDYIFELGNEYSLSLSWEGISQAPQAKIASRRAQLEKQFASYGLQWTNSHASVDITPKGVSKQTGIKHLLKEIGLSPSAAIAIGDSHNDLKMLAYVGHPMCPDNASPEVKALCKVIARQPLTAGVVELLSGILAA